MKSEELCLTHEGLKFNNFYHLENISININLCLIEVGY